MVGSPALFASWDIAAEMSRPRRGKESATGFLGTEFSFYGSIDADEPDSVLDQYHRATPVEPLDLGSINGAAISVRAGADNATSGHRSSDEAPPQSTWSMAGLYAGFIGNGELATESLAVDLTARDASTLQAQRHAWLGDFLGVENSVKGTNDHGLRIML
jgi:hypothetical protein